MFIAKLDNLILIQRPGLYLLYTVSNILVHKTCISSEMCEEAVAVHIIRYLVSYPHTIPHPKILT